MFLQGVGLSVHGPFRVATENTLFAMPETFIGILRLILSSFLPLHLRGAVKLSITDIARDFKGRSRETLLCYDH